jgi:hypothetical protein
MKKTAMIMSLSLASAGCATFPSFPIIKQFNVVKREKTMNYVAPEINPDEAGRIAKDMAKFLAMQLPPAKTTLEIDSSGTSFHDILSTELVWRGFGVVENPEDGAVKLRYFVTPLDTGIVVRMKYDQHVAGRFYQRGTPLMGGAYVVRGADK